MVMLEASAHCYLFYLYVGSVCCQMTLPHLNFSWIDASGLCYSNDYQVNSAGITVFLQLCVNWKAAVVFDWFINDKSASALPRRRPALNVILLQSQDKSINLTHTHPHALQHFKQQCHHFMLKMSSLSLFHCLSLIPSHTPHAQRMSVNINKVISLSSCHCDLTHTDTHPHTASVVIHSR